MEIPLFPKGEADSEVPSLAWSLQFDAHNSRFP